jgi:hypothetical protein
MDTKHTPDTNRRTLLKAMARFLAPAWPAACCRSIRSRSGKAAVNLQLGWLPGNNQIGEVVAKQLGYFRGGRPRRHDPARRAEHRRRRDRRFGQVRDGPGVVVPSLMLAARRTCRSSASRPACSSIRTHSSR